MESAISLISEYIPAEVDILSALKFLATFGAAALALGFVIKLIFGSKSDLNHALSSVMGILCIYALTVVIDTFNPRELSRYLAPLPFVVFTEEYMMVMPITASPFPDLCTQILSMVILAFLMNLMDTIMPKGKSLLSWYLGKAVAVVLAMILHYLATTALNTFLPGVLAAYAQTILVVILIVLLFLGLLKVLLGLALGAIDPFIGFVASFFFSNVIGKQLSKAVLTTIVLTGIVYLLECTGYTVICITVTALTAYIPLIAALLVLWYIIGHIL